MTKKMKLKKDCQKHLVTLPSSANIYDREVAENIAREYCSSLCEAKDADARLVLLNKYTRRMKTWYMKK